jgi:dihydrofolate reductase
MIHPIVLGSGKRLFDDVTAEMPLKLLKSETFKTGVISATYEPPAG